MSNSSVPIRSGLDPKYCWDLSRLYSSEKEWEADFLRLDVLLEKYQSFRGRLGDSPETLLHALECDDELSLLEERLATFAHLRSDEDTGASKPAALLGRIQSKSAEIEGATAWFEPELMHIDREKFKAFRESDVLAFYKRTLDETEREREHTLSAPEERILGLYCDALGTPDKVFGFLNDADLRFPRVPGESGKRIELTHGNYRKFMESPDRTVRKKAFQACYKVYASHKNTFAALLDGTVRTNAVTAKLRNYPDTLTGTLSGANIPPEVYTSLVSSVRNRFSVLYDYFALRAKVLGLEKLEMYDIQNPLLPDAPRREYSYEEAAALVKEACRPLGETYCNALNRAFTDRWIDVYECRGKRSGAYSGGCYGAPPYLLLNYNGTLDSVSTLAHELGHSMHSYFSNETQKYHYASYHIFAAEIASTTNELLLHHHLMETSSDPALKTYLRGKLIDDFRGTLFRQTMFAEFEQKIYSIAENGGTLTPDELCEIYHTLNGDYHGPAVENTAEIQYEWARIPHFHYCFYVYQYATGISAAAKLAQEILKGNTEPYLAFLRAGDSRDVIDIIRDAGVDFSSAAPVDAAIDLFARTLDELKADLQ